MFYKKSPFCLPYIYHVVPKGASHHGLGLLADVEAVSTKKRAIRAAILRKTHNKYVNVTIFGLLASVRI